MMAVSRLSHSMPASKLGAAPACRSQRSECLISRHCNMNGVLSNRCITAYHMDCHGIYPPDCPVCSGTPTGSRCLRQVQAPLQRPRSLHEEFVRVCSPLLCSLLQWLFKSCRGVYLPQGRVPTGQACPCSGHACSASTQTRWSCHEGQVSPSWYILRASVRPLDFFVLHAGWRLCGAPSVSLGLSDYPILHLGLISALALVVLTLNNQVGHLDPLWQNNRERGQQAQADHAKNNPKTQNRPSILTHLCSS